MMRDRASAHVSLTLLGRGEVQGFDETAIAESESSG
jgi:hypothetical protein